MLRPGIRASHLSRYIITPVLTRLGMHSLQAHSLMMGTAAVESRMGCSLVQIGGPALGMFQMEPPTHESLWEHYLKYHPEYGDDIRRLVYLFTGQEGPINPELMIHNLWYATAMARIKYWRSSFAWPKDLNDIEGLGQIWKQHYNTPQGKGTVKKFVERYEKYVR